MHNTLRMGLLIKEFKKCVDAPVKVVIGDPIGRDKLDPLAKDSRAMMEYLRRVPYELAPDIANPDALGYEFEAHHRT